MALLRSRARIWVLGGLLAAFAAAAASAQFDDGTLIIDEAFAGQTEGEFPEGWEVRSPDILRSQGKGPRIANAPDGSDAVRFESIPRPGGLDAEMYRDFGEGVVRGRIVARIYTPSVDPGIFNVEGRVGGSRVFGIELTGNYRFRDRADSVHSSGNATLRDQWFDVIIEWDSEKSVYHGFYRAENGTVTRITPPEGGEFNFEYVGRPITRVHFRHNQRDTPVTAYLGRVQVYKLD